MWKFCPMICLFYRIPSNRITVYEISSNRLPRPLNYYSRSEEIRSLRAGKTYFEAFYRKSVFYGNCLKCDFTYSRLRKFRSPMAATRPFSSCLTPTSRKFYCACAIWLSQWIYKQLMAELRTVFLRLPWRHDQELLTKPIIYELTQSA